MSNHTQTLIVATRNAHKTEEIRAMLGSSWIVEDLCEREDLPIIEETGTTFEENATLKAVEISKFLDAYVLSDDSGLAVDALGGAPGVYSSRYAGEEGKHIANNIKLLNELNTRQAKLPQDRTARFHCCMVIAKSGEKLGAFEGVIDGHITTERRGDAGFGYDPLFIPEGHSETFGELPSRVKNALSHRARALEKAISFLKTKLF